MSEVEAAKSEVLEHLSGLLAAENRNDVEGAIQFYAKDMYLIAPGMDILKGGDRMREVLQEALKGQISNSHEYVDVQFSHSGDLCFVVGKYHLSTDDPDFEFPKSGKFLLVLRKTDGQWKVVVNCFNN